MTNDELRASLNEYYSSKSTAQATYVLTVALIAVGLIGLRISKFPLALILSILAAASVRMAYRISYWGMLSHRVLYVAPENEKGRTKIYALHEGAYENVQEGLFWRSKPLRWLLLVVTFLVTLWVLNGTAILTMQ